MKENAYHMYSTYIKRSLEALFIFYFFMLHIIFIGYLVTCCKKELHKAKIYIKLICGLELQYDTLSSILYK